MSNTLNISLQTVKKYLWYLEKTYIIEKSLPFFRNVRKEITKSPIYYFIDLGIRNYLLDIYSFGSTIDKGFVFQNFVFNQVRKIYSNSISLIKFWRTKQGVEVDIIIDNYPTPIGIKVKYSNGENMVISRSMNSFIDKFKPKKIFIVSLLYGKIKEVTPFYKIQDFVK